MAQLVRRHELVGPGRAPAGPGYGQPVEIIETERLLLRAIDDGGGDAGGDDEAALLAIHQHPGLRRFVPQAVVERAADLEPVVTRLRGFDDGVLGVRMIERRSDGVVVGLIMLKDIPASAGAEVRDVEIGWRGHPDHGGRGYIAEAALAVLERALSAGLPRVVAVTRDENEPSLAVMRRIGMRDAGITDDYYDRQGLRLFVAP